MAKTVEDLVKAAREEVPAIAPAEARALHGREDVVFLDVREPQEVAAGKVPGALAVPRGVWVRGRTGPPPCPRTRR